MKPATVWVQQTPQLGLFILTNSESIYQEYKSPILYPNISIIQCTKIHSFVIWGSFLHGVTEHVGCSWSRNICTGFIAWFKSWFSICLSFLMGCLFCWGSEYRIWGNYWDVWMDSWGEIRVLKDFVKLKRLPLLVFILSSASLLLVRPWKNFADAFTPKVSLSETPSN
jgi:hypothetical protein